MEQKKKTFIRLIKYVAQEKAQFNEHLSNARLCELENEKNEWTLVVFLQTQQNRSAVGTVYIMSEGKIACPWDENQASLALRLQNLGRMSSTTRRDVSLRSYGTAPVDQICRVYKFSRILETTSTF